MFSACSNWDLPTVVCYSTVNQYSATAGSFRGRRVRQMFRR